MSDDFYEIEDGRGGGIPTSIRIDDDKLIIKNVVDLEGSLDSVKETALDYSGSSNLNMLGNDGHLAARIPMPVYDYLMRIGIVQDKERLKAWLNDPDNAVFRIWKGRL